MNLAKGILLFFCALLIVFSSCRNPITKPIEIVEPEKNIEINNDASDLSTSVTFYNATEMPVYGFQPNKDNELQELSSNTFRFLKCASIVSERWQGTPYHITDMKVCGDYAMICSLSESDIATLVTVIYLINPKVPSIISQAYLPHRYVTHFDFNDNVMFIAETIDPDYFENYQSNLAIERIDLKNFMFTSQDTMIESRFGIVSEVLFLNGAIYLASDDKNSVQILNSKTLETKQLISLDRVQTLRSCRGQIVAIQANPFRFTFFDQQNSGVYHTTLAKCASTMAYAGAIAIDEQIVATGCLDAGLSVHTLSDGALVQIIEPVDWPTSVIPMQYLTRNADMDQDILFTANGLGGCTVFQNCEYPIEQFERIGYLDFRSPVKQVRSNGNVLLVLCENNTIQIIEKVQIIPEPAHYRLLCDFDNWGVPNNLQSQMLSVRSKLLEQVNQFLPESIPVFTYHPQLMAQSIPTLSIEKDTEVTITFLQELTGWKNSVGYYTYPSSIKPIQLSQILNMTLLFPNISMKGHGGGLVAGDSVCLGEVDAGSELGFFMIAQGWNNGQVTQGSSRFLTDYQLTDSQLPNHLFFYEPNQHAIILTFEEMDRTLETCDHDFNDVVLSIQIKPETAVDTKIFPQIVF